VAQERYGAPAEVLRLTEVEEPVPGPRDVLVRVHSVALAGDDWHLTRGLPYVARLDLGLRRPKAPVPGRDLAGVVTAVGSEVTRFAAGDEVFGWHPGALAEYAAVPVDALMAKPPRLSMPEAAALPTSGMTALQAVRDKAAVAAADEVLVIGASGGVGTLAVQLAAATGAHVTGVCSSGNADLVRSLGARAVIDYAATDLERLERRYDVIVDMVGAVSLAGLRRALSSAGTLVMVGGSGGRWLKGTGRWVRAMAISPLTRQRLRPLIHSDRRADLAALSELVQAGRLKPVVTRSFPLDRLHDAIGHFEAGHARGKLVITMPEGTGPGAGSRPAELAARR
jgi:NADPH:quinone reductase-like Zn-dependent oxidoreductase